MQSKICFKKVCISINSIILGLFFAIAFLYIFNDNRIIILKKNKYNKYR